MEFKKIMLISVLLVILTLGAVSASSINETSDDLSINDESTIEVIEVCDNLSANDDEILSTGEGSFSDIQTMVDNANEGDTVVLSGTYLGNGTQITVNKQITIDGNNSTLDAKHSSRIFDISASNVILKNIILANGNSSTNGGAVYWSGANGNVINCQFSDNQAYDGGAIYFRSSNGVIENSSFIDNSAYYNGAVYMNCLNGKIIGCNFTNNRATNSSGAVGWVKKDNGGISNSRFINNYALYGGAIYVNNATDFRIENSEFENNSAAHNGGAIYWDGGNKGKITNSVFKNNMANDNGGAIYFYEDDDIAVYDCDFVNCSAKTNLGGAIYYYNPNGTNVTVFSCNFVNCSANSGGAIRWYGAKGSVHDCNFVNCSASDKGGAIYWYSNVTNGSVYDCNFVDCYATYCGGAIYWDSVNGVVSDCSFVNCSADDCGGAIYWYYKANNGYVFGCSFVDCSANCGGAIYWDYYANNGSVLGCSFVNCSAIECGGAIYWDHDEGNIGNSTFINNNADMGRAIYVSEDSVDILNSKFIDNNAANLNDAVHGGIISNCDLNVKLQTKTTLTVNDDTVYLGDKISITPKVLDEYAPVNGVVKLIIGGNLFDSVAIGDKFYYTPTEVGNYTVSATFEGDEYYLASGSDNLAFTVLKAAPKMNIYLEDIAYGETEVINVTIPISSTGYVTLNLYKGNQLTVNLSAQLIDGAASFYLSDLNIGTYDVNVHFDGDSNYDPISENGQFTVRPSIVMDHEATVGDDCRIFFDLGSNVTDSVIVRVDNKAVAVLDIEEGILNSSFSTSKLTAGDHSVSLQYEGDLFDGNVFNYWDAQSSKFAPITYDLHLNPIEVIIPETVQSNDEGIIVLEFPENATGTVEVYINGVKAVVVEIVNGIAKIDLSQYKNGNYEIVFKYLGDDVYAGFSKNMTVNIYVKVAKITASAFKVVYTSKNKYSVKVYDSNNKLSSGVKVTFLINGKTYKTVKTTSKGVASVVINKVPGTYKITSKAAGVKVTKKLTVNHLLTLKSVKVKRSAKKLVLTATLKKVNGKYLKNKKVTFKFNGKKYTSKTNKKGVAKVTIKSKVLKKLKVGKKVNYQATYLKDTVKKTVKVKK